MKPVFTLAAVFVLAIAAISAGQAANWATGINGDPGEPMGAYWWNGGSLNSPLVSEPLSATNWAYKMEGFFSQAQIQSLTNSSGTPLGTTLYARFKPVTAFNNQNVRMQVMDGGARLQMNWLNGTWSLNNGSGNSWSQPADTWVTMWLTIDGPANPSAPPYTLWLQQPDGSWAIASQGTTVFGSTPLPIRFGNNSPNDIALTYLDFWYIYHNGAYAPTDPNAPVPEPASVLVLASGLAGMAGLIRKRR